MHCNYFEQKKCLSCQWLTKPYSQQLNEKQQDVEHHLQRFTPEIILLAVASSEQSFRNKAKMVVTGTAEKPILGIINHEQQPIDLCECPLYPQEIQQALIKVREYIQQVRMTPYNINKKKGELKFIILTYHKPYFMLRFVLRSHEQLDCLKQTMHELHQKIPELLVISANIQPIHAAILEGEEEIIFTESTMLPAQLNHVPLFIRPKSFFQTNTKVAEQLYSTAAQWINEINQKYDYHINNIWDLFCGVGGFGLHCVVQKNKLTGIEINEEAISCAQLTANRMGFKNIHFRALDSTQFALSQTETPNIVLVNPPRRGIGQALANYLTQVAPEFILYSSCNIVSLAKDLQWLLNYKLVKVQLFDMFPHTYHYEVMVLLEKK